MGNNDNTLAEIQSLRSEMAELGNLVGDLKEILIEIRGAVLTDHQKLEKLEVTSKYDHRMIKALEETRKSLEVTGRIQVARSPVGL